MSTNNVTSGGAALEQSIDGTGHHPMNPFEVFGLLKEHVDAQLKSYVSNMGKEMKIFQKGKNHTSIGDWARLVNIGDQHATMGWCFAIEYILSNELKKKVQKSHVEYIVDLFRETRNLDECTRTKVRRKGTHGSTTEFDNLTKAALAIFNDIRKDWRRKLRGGDRGNLLHVQISDRKEVVNLGSDTLREDMPEDARVRYKNRKKTTFTIKKGIAVKGRVDYHDSCQWNEWERRVSLGWSAVGFVPQRKDGQQDTTPTPPDLSPPVAHPTLPRETLKEVGLRNGVMCYEALMPNGQWVQMTPLLSTPPPTEVSLQTGASVSTASGLTTIGANIATPSQQAWNGGNYLPRQGLVEAGLLGVAGSQVQATLFARDGASAYLQPSLGNGQEHKALDPSFPPPPTVGTGGSAPLQWSASSGGSPGGKSLQGFSQQGELVDLQPHPLLRDEQETETSIQAENSEEKSSSVCDSHTDVDESSPDSTIAGIIDTPPGDNRPSNMEKYGHGMLGGMNQTLLVNRRPSPPNMGRSSVLGVPMPSVAVAGVVCATDNGTEGSGMGGVEGQDEVLADTREDTTAGHSGQPRKEEVPAVVAPRPGISSIVVPEKSASRGGNGQKTRKGASRKRRGDMEGKEEKEDGEVPHAPKRRSGTRGERGAKETGPLKKKREETKQLAIGYNSTYVRTYAKKEGGKKIMYRFLVGIGCANYKGRETAGKLDCSVPDFSDLEWMEHAEKDKSHNWLYCWNVDEKYFEENGKHRPGTKIYCQACYHYIQAGNEDSQK